MLFSKIKLLCLATLLAGVCVRAVAPPDPAKWEADIAAFEAADRTNAPPKGAVLFVGSSTIRFWRELASDFPEFTVVRRGFGGSHLPDISHFAERVIFPYAPSKIAIYGGDNDIARGHSPEQVYADFRQLVAKIRGALPKAKIYFLSIKPSPSRWHLAPQSREANRLIRRYCRMRPKVEYIDLWNSLLGKEGRPDPALFEKDKLHVNREGYGRWIPLVREALQD